MRATPDYTKYDDILDWGSCKVRQTRWAKDKKPYLEYTRKMPGSSAERHALYEYAKIANGVIVELGTLYGAGAVTMAYGLHEAGGGQMYCVDNFGQRNPNCAYDDIGDASTVAIMTEYFKRFPTTALNLCQGDTAEWASKIDPKVDLLFIDADHTYVSCKRDFVAWSPKVKRGGLIAFHDAQFTGVNQVISELTPDFSLVEQIFSLKIFRKTV